MANLTFYSFSNFYNTDSKTISESSNTDEDFYIVNALILVSQWLLIIYLKICQERFHYALFFSAVMLPVVVEPLSIFIHLYRAWL